MNEHERYLKWARQRKFTYWILFLRLPLALMVLPLFLTSISTFICFIGICTIIYFWIEICEDFKSNDVLTKFSKNFYMISAAVFLFVLLISAHSNVFYVCVIIGITIVGYVFFKLYKLFNNGIKNKSIRLNIGTCIFTTGMIAAIILYSINSIYLGIAVCILLIVYAVFDIVVRYVVEKSDTNRQI